MTRLPRASSTGTSPGPLHFQRYEFKYFLPERWIPGLIERLAPFTEVDPFLRREPSARTSYPVTSLYFDSWDLQSWREKEGGQLARRKVRLRTYEPTFREGGPNHLEIKRRFDAVVLKDRIRLPDGMLADVAAAPDPLRRVLRDLDPESPIVREVGLLAAWFNLRSTALVRYERTALVARQDRRLRITVDHDLEGAWRPASFVGDASYRRLDSLIAAGLTGIAGRYAILEVKADGAFPAWLHAAIRDLGLTRTAYSKYFLAVLALRPRILEDCDAALDGREVAAG